MAMVDTDTPPSDNAPPTAPTRPAKNGPSFVPRKACKQKRRARSPISREETSSLVLFASLPRDEGRTVFCWPGWSRRRSIIGQWLLHTRSPTQHDSVRGIAHVSTQSSWLPGQYVGEVLLVSKDNSVLINDLVKNSLLLLCTYC